MGAPKYPGSFIGHNVKVSSHLVGKKVCWEDKQTFQMRFGIVFGSEYEEYTWNGKEWIKK
jgi:hypothetical protein